MARLQSAGPILLVLDECHHLLEVWGGLLAELLVELPQARVLGLTATPPATMTQPQAALVDELFGAPVFEASIPAVVREGDLAPFAELVWLTTPTPAEQDWLDEGASRFRELTTALTRPGFGSTGFLAWCDARFVERGDADPGWPALVRAEPELTTAALRLHHAGLLALPPGARMGEEHRVEPTADDWILLVDDWLRRCITASDEPGDEAVLDAVRRALPAVGWVWTRRGVRRGRTPVDRVLARSESKTTATVAVVDAERRTLGERLRMLVLCDHESAGATLPVDLEGVLAQQAGSAWAVLAALVSSPAGADALLVTGRSVAGDEATLRRLVAHVAQADAALASRLVVVPGTGVERGVARLEGRWTSRTWVRHVTAFFEAGGTHVLVGTRGLLGEGWDARRVSGLVDLTSATTSTAVVQTRGRALRTDPTWPDKVALTWSVTCVAPEHPRGGNDWSRLVRKHAGYFGVDEDGEVVDGVAHLDDAFSPFAPPDPAELDAVNARMLVRAEHRDAVRERWAVGTPYDDRAARSVRIRPRRADAVVDTAGVPGVVQREDGLEVRGPGGAGPAVWPTTAVVALALGGAAALGTALAWAARCRRRGARRGGGRDALGAPRGRARPGPAGRGGRAAVAVPDRRGRGRRAAPGRPRGGGGRGGERGGGRVGGVPLRAHRGVGGRLVAVRRGPRRRRLAARRAPLRDRALGGRPARRHPRRGAGRGPRATPPGRPRHLARGARGARRAGRGRAGLRRCLGPLGGRRAPAVDRGSGGGGRAGGPARCRPARRDHGDASHLELTGRSAVGGAVGGPR